MSQKSISAVILAGGQGKRLHSDKPKTLTKILGKPIIDWIISALDDAGIKDVCVVTGYAHEYLDEHLAGRCETVFQSERLGTGHAVMTASEFIKKHSDGDVLIYNGDAPFADRETLLGSLDHHRKNGCGVTVISAEVDDPQGYGRIIRSGDGISAIREQKDCSEEEKAVREINSGCFWFSAAELLNTLPKLTRNNSQNEYYITDCVEILLASGLRADAYIAKDRDIVLSANDRKGMLDLNNIARKRVILGLLESGVEITCTDGLIISPDVKIAPGAEIKPGCELSGRTVIGKNCVIGPNCRLNDTEVGEGSVLNSVVANGAKLGKGCTVGPFVQLRPGTVLGDLVHVGDFVEIKNSEIGAGSAVAHFNYVGDSDVGTNVNFGCGAVTANYDGTNKSRCTVGNNAFIGCNTNLVAPVKIGEAAYTAAGSTVTRDVPDGALVIERADQKIREGYSEKKLARHLEKGKKFQDTEK